MMKNDEIGRPKCAQELNGWLERETLKLGKMQEHGLELEKRLETRQNEVSKGYSGLWGLRWCSS